MTQLEKAKRGEITPELQKVAQDEKIDIQLLRKYVVEGKVVIPSNKKRASRIIGIGKGLRTKINASIGTSTEIIDIDMEIEKAKIAQRYGADTLMDLSVGGDIAKIRREIMKATSLPVGTVPLYEAFAISIERYGAAVNMPEELLWEVMERQCEDGVSFMAIHCGINRRTVDMLRR